MKHILLILLLILLCSCSLGLEKPDLQQELHECITIVEELEAGQIVGLNNDLRYIISGSIIAAGCFIVLTFVSPKLGIMGLVGSGSTLGLAIMTGLHSGLIGWLLLALFTFGVLSVAYHIWTERRAIVEVIGTAEILKNTGYTEAKEDINALQTKRTKKIVGEIRKKTI